MAVAINVCATNSTVNNLSRNALLIWVNKTLSATFKKIEDLSSGDAYCQLTNLLFPQAINPVKIKTGSSLEYDHLNNWKLLQNAFVKLNVEKNIPIGCLMKRHFQDNFEFLQWFKRFYDANSEANNNNTDCEKTCDGDTEETKKTSTDLEKSNLGESFEVLDAEKKDFEEMMKTTETERDFYYGKLRKIEILCQENMESDKMAEKIISVLYASDAEEPAAQP